HRARVRRRQEDHVAGRVRRAVRAGEVPLRAVTADRPRWAAVVVEYESGPLLGECVDALTADDSAGPVEVVVVDNGSTGGSVAAMLARHPDVAGITPHATLGYTRAYRQTDADPARPRDVDWVSGAALWFRREVLDRIGGWDERYFMFLEDVDVCRAIKDAGGGIRYEPGATVTHVVGASRRRAP